MKSPLRKAIAVGLTSFCGSTVALDSATTVSSALSMDCMEYKVVGICYWLFCTNFGCSVRTSTKVRHFIPELVVSSYANTGANPWTDVASMSSPNALSQGGGNDHSSEAYSSQRFKNVDAIGHPGGYLLTQAASSSGYICKSGATAFMPYFLSTLDPLSWRHSIPESLYPEALIPGMREIGSISSSWGHIYPRSGWVNQSNDYKAAAVIAQRAGDLVTQSGQPHIYIPLSTQTSDGYWPPGEIKEGDISTHKWQALWPVLDDTCAVFPNGGLNETFADRQAEDGAYAWAFWRPYACCERKGQIFLGSTDFR
ncbi:integrating conjugative element protein [Pseudomonas sp. PA15(2017)]|uniref:TIGR03756 family integrating conjugative element protein n=1 Tax=Pseudomonas sp. PA15(2017) TaxID=1932111 RepID=UPI00095BCFA5|nr:TIGR03756 family integrating conjugative element protein [Pseudomonas sp. PA15(2017)]OLU25512.1 integrating conjugative element protein [Pseudomonas sp. PA15(2017)]